MAQAIEGKQPLNSVESGGMISRRKVARAWPAPRLHLPVQPPLGVGTALRVVKNYQPVL